MYKIILYTTRFVHDNKVPRKKESNLVKKLIIFDYM